MFFAPAMWPELEFIGRADIEHNGLLFLHQFLGLVDIEHFWEMARYGAAVPCRFCAVVFRTSRPVKKQRDEGFPCA